MKSKNCLVDGWWSNLSRIKSLECMFKYDEDRDNSIFGDIELRWDI